MNKKGNEQQKITLFAPKGQFDISFFILVIVLLCIGLVMVFSASYVSAYFEHGNSYYYIKRQAVFAGIGLIAMLFISRLNYNILRIFAYPAYAVSIVLLVLVLFIGKGNFGEKRWLYIAGINVQPSEIAKIAVIMTLALYISLNYSKMKKLKTGFVIPGLIIALAAGLVIIEPHLSGAVLIGGVGIVMLIMGGSNLKHLGVLSGLAATGFVGMITMTDYMQSRIRIWMNPASDARGKGFQTLQSLYAVGSGGPFGLGLGGSRQKYLYIPEPQNDFIFAIVCEELGFIGAMLIILLFAALIYRGFVIAWNAPDKFGALLVSGIMTKIALQTVLNIAVVTNTIPVTGISLPFFSSGGTSLTILMAEMGIVLSVSNYSRLNKGEG